MSRYNTTQKSEKNPALKIRDFYSFSLQILNEINYARMHPDEFAQKLEELRNTISDDNCLYIEGLPFLYTDLKSSLDDAIYFLQNQENLPGLVYNRTISQACDYLLDELIIHDGIDEANEKKYNIETRLNKFGEPLGEIFELIDYGMFSPEFIVINFILCDGDPEKYERKVLFNSKIKVLGIASSLLPSEKICTVLNFCEEFFDKYETVPLEIQMKYKKQSPKYQTKTIKSYNNQKELETKNLDFDDENYIDNLEKYSFKRKNSGKLYDYKKTQFNRQNSFNQKNDQEEKNNENNSQKLQTNFKKNEENLMQNFRDDRITIRKKRTLHEPKVMDVIEENQNDNDEDGFDKEFEIKSPPKELKTRGKNQKDIKIISLNDESEKKNNSKKIEQKISYENGKKIISTKTTENKNGEIVEKEEIEEVDEEPKKVRTEKIVKEIPKKYYYRKINDTKDNIDKEVENELKKMEKDYKVNFGNLDFKPSTKPHFESTEDMYEKEDDIDIPEGAIEVKVKQKTITDSSGVPVLIVHKTIMFEDGSKRNIIEKKNIVKK